MFVYVLLGAEDSVWVGDVADTRSPVARVEAGKAVPKPLRESRPVRLAAMVGPFRRARGEKHFKTVLRGLEPARMRAFLAGSQAEISLLAGMFPDFSLRFWTGGPPPPLDWVKEVLEAGGGGLERSEAPVRPAPVLRSGCDRGVRGTGADAVRPRGVAATSVEADDRGAVGRKNRSPPLAGSPVHLLVTSRPSPGNVPATSRQQPTGSMGAGAG